MERSTLSIIPNIFIFHFIQGMGKFSTQTLKANDARSESPSNENDVLDEVDSGSKVNEFSSLQKKVALIIILSILQSDELKSNRFPKDSGGSREKKNEKPG